MTIFSLAFLFTLIAGFGCSQQLPHRPQSSQNQQSQLNPNALRLTKQQQQVQQEEQEISHLMTIFTGNRSASVRKRPIILSQEQILARSLMGRSTRLGRPPCEFANQANRSSSYAFCLPNPPLLVQTRLFPIKLMTLYEKDEALAFTARLQLSWKDPALMWNPHEHGMQTTVIMPGGSIWQPNLQISNSLNDLYGILRDQRFEFKIDNDGTVWWHPTGLMQVRCEVQLDFFPFDFQICPLVIESVIYTHLQLNLTLRRGKSPASMSMFAESGLFSLVGVEAGQKVSWVSDNTAFTAVHFWLILRRRSAYYLLNVIFPCAMLSTLQVLTFLLPLDDSCGAVQGGSGRVSEATTILLSVFVFQSMVVQDLPKSSGRTPLLCLYLEIVTGVSVISVSTSVLVSYLMSKRRDRVKCPTCLKPFLQLIYLFRTPKLDKIRVKFQTKQSPIVPTASSPVYPSKFLQHVCPSEARNLLVTRPKSALVTWQAAASVVAATSCINSPAPEQVPCVDDLPIEEHLLVDWIFLANFVNTVAFASCAVAVATSPLFLFYVLPPSHPDFGNLLK